MSPVLRKVLIYTTFWFIVFIAFYFFFWRGSIDILNRESDNIDKVKTGLSQIRKYIADWPVTAERELKKAEEDLEKFLAKIPDEEDIPNVLKKIQEYGIKNAQLDLISIENITKEQKTKKEKNGDSEEGKGKYAKSTYKLAANGKYFDVIQFLRNLETTERLINVEEFSLNTSIDTDSTELDLTFSIFYSKPDTKHVIEERVGARRS